MGVRLKSAPAPGSEEWRSLITASKVPAMIRDQAGAFLGWDYVSAHERYLEMRGEWARPIDQDLQELFDEAHDMEDFAVNHFMRKSREKGNMWRQSNHEVAYHDPDWGIPHVVTLDRVVSVGRRRAIVEVKRPVRQKGHLPRNWYIQVVFQMRISGIHEAYLVEVPRYGDVVIHEIEWNQAVAEKIITDCEYFHHLVTEGVPPELGASEHANDILSQRYPHPAPGEVTVSDSEFDELMAAWKAIKHAEAHARVLENRLKEKMGDAGKATYDGKPVVRRTAGRFAMSRIPDEHKGLLEAPELQKTSFDQTKLKKKYPDVYEAACGAAGYAVDRAKWLK